MNLDAINTLLDYSYWARDRILTAAEGMTDEEFRKPNGFTYDSLHAILAHALAAEVIWLERLRGVPAPVMIPESEVATLPDLKARWTAEEARMRAYLAAQTDASLAADFVFTGRDGQERRTPIWLLLTHVANHGTQHRSEAAEALTMIGRSPGSLDLTTMYWSRPK